MAFDDFADPVLDAVRTLLTASWTVTAIGWPNENFDPAEYGPWVLVEVQRSLYGQQSIGESDQSDNRWDEEGVLFIYVNVPQGIGTSKAAGAAKSLVDVFRGKTLLDGSLEFMDASIDSGATGVIEGNWYTVTSTVDWRRMDA